jgi:[acyl-carrier-protein] S-malonyltransferase
MIPAAERLAEVLRQIEITEIKIPVVTNVEATPNTDSARVRDLLVAQVCAAVKWDSSVREMISLGVSSFIEIGPGKVLSGLVKRIDKEVVSVNIEDSASLKALQV